MKQPGEITGYQHKPDCLCGCHLVVGEPGVLKRTADTPKLAKLGGGVYTFRPAARAGTTVEVYYEVEVS